MSDIKYVYSAHIEFMDDEEEDYCCDDFCIRDWVLVLTRCYRIGEKLLNPIVSKGIPLQHIRMYEIKENSNELS